MDNVRVKVGSAAHGGHCVARHEGRVIFVRHTLPGEEVTVRLTDAEPEAKFWRGDAVEIHVASADRVESAWPEAGPGGVGGAELAHVDDLASPDVADGGRPRSREQRTGIIATK